MNGDSKFNPLLIQTNNRAQCWDCKNCEGMVVAQEEDDGKFYALPVCSFDGGKIMNEVYSHHCPGYEEK